MTFDEYLTVVLARAFPSGYSARLKGNYRAWLKDCFIEAQKYIPQLQSNHLEYIGQDATYFSCGCSVFDAPLGKIKSLHTVLTTDACDKVLAYPYTEGEFKALVEQRSHCACEAERLPDDQYMVGSDYYYYPTNLPLGLSYATPSIDAPVRSKERAFSVHDSRIWTWPVLNSDETAVLRWSGVKRSWKDSDEVTWKDEAGDDDEEILALAELKIRWCSKLYHDCDESGAASLKGLYDTAFAELKVDRKQLEVPEDIIPIRL